MARFSTSRRRARVRMGFSSTASPTHVDESRVNRWFGRGGSTKKPPSSGAVDAVSEAPARAGGRKPSSSVSSLRVSPPRRCRASTSGGRPTRWARTPSVRAGPTVKSDTAWVTASVRATSSSSAVASRSPSSSTSTSWRRSSAVNSSCSWVARPTSSTSSNRRARWLAGVRRRRLRSGRCTSTRRSRPTSDATPKPGPWVVIPAPDASDPFWRAPVAPWGDQRPGRPRAVRG